MTYDPNVSAILFLDPYNDFLSEGGKLWPLVKPVAEAVQLIDHLDQVVTAARAHGLRIFVVPHHRATPGDYVGWKFPNPDQVAGNHLQLFAKGSWGGEWHPAFVPKPEDLIAQEHWSQNGFAGTDLNRLLRQHGVERVVLIGLLANTCIEATARGAMELGYHVTLIKDATAAFSPDRMHAAHSLNGPNYAHALLSTLEFVAALDAVPASASMP